MGEIRKDYILDRWVYFASERKKRPKQFKKKEFVEEGTCYFCPGNENLTPPEIGRIEEKGKWKIRWFPNKFPVVHEDRRLGTISNKKFFYSTHSYGKHEVIAETNNHKKQLWDLPKNHIKQLLNVYKDRVVELSKLKNVKYVQVFKNHGREAGTSLIHSHTQIVALHRIPSLVKEEVIATNKYIKCPYCRIIKEESKSPRKCFENKNFIAFTPYASRFNYEVWVFPKKHIRNLAFLLEEEMEDLAAILEKILKKLRKLNVSYNYFIHNSPQKQNFHFHLEIIPRIAGWAGFEYSTDSIINSVLPEDAARYYRS